MGTVPSSAGVADLLQALSSAGSPLASTFSSPALQSVLQNSSPADIVKLSDQALQLQETDELFGVSDYSAGSATPDTGNLFAALDSTLYGSTTPTSSSESAQLAAAQSQLQSEQTAALLGVSDSSAGSATSDTDNLLATLDSTAYGSTTPTSSSGSAQLAAAQSQLQAEQTAALFGTSTDATASNQLLNVVG